MNDLDFNQLREFDPRRHYQLPKSTAHRRFPEGPSCIGGKFWKRECHRYSKHIGIGTPIFWRAGIARKTFSLFASIDNHDVTEFLVCFVHLDFEAQCLQNYPTSEDAQILYDTLLLS